MKNPEFTSPATQNDDNVTLRAWVLEEVIASLTVLVNEGEGDDDNQKLDSFQATLTTILHDVVQQMAFKKEIPENAESLYHFLFIAQDTANRLRRRDTMRETLEKIVEYANSEFCIGSKGSTKTFCQMHQVVSAALFVNGYQDDLSFATRFFIAFVR